ncbi:MAG: hypothetical protein F6J89_25005 [Symploca sp. SIO1C4]|uniref:Uncharacterized protein n=1 Tax=Symploca sp. SIO1C4 TaxID=2607765 RepID=A0A6B3NGF7_9CYAN|nr:hypothetical protein [Symploca sp. SIO1C4]
MNQDYIAEQINRIESHYQGNQQLVENSCWRIASNADLFDKQLNPDGTLTPTQQQQVDEFIDNFKASRTNTKPKSSAQA